MNLLYCLDGVVLGNHESVLNVPASVYGTGVRIIPYPDPMGTLTKIGDPPALDVPPGQRAADSRPYAEPAPTPTLLIGYASQVRFDVVTAGITWNSIPINTERISQLMIGNLAQYALSVDPATLIDFTQDGIAYQFPASDVADLNTQVNAHVQGARTIEAECITDLTSATPTILTYEDVEARFSALAAKTLHGKLKPRRAR